MTDESETILTGISLGLLSPNAQMRPVKLGDEITIRITGRVSRVSQSYMHVDGNIIQTIELTAIKVEEDPPG